MKKLLLTLLSFMVTFAVNAERVSKKEALQKAQQFMPGRHFVDSKSVASARAQTSVKADAFYIFNAEDNGGYVIVSGDDRTREILSYADKGNLDMNKIPENMKWWLDNIASQIEALGTTLKPAARLETRSGMSAIAPLIQTEWAQKAPYNYMCPDGNYVDYYEEGYDVNNRCPTGCVATAMAQLMYYWKWPKTCPALEGYSINYYDNGNFIETNRIKGIPSTTFKWDKMVLNYGYNESGEVANAVAELMRYCGQAVKMQYSNDEGSGGYPNPSVLAYTFKFSKNMHELGRNAYTTAQWESMIYGELVALRPVLYSGSSKSVGHQFIVDGYDGEGLFHMNWGWGDGGSYSVLSVADPDTEQGVGGNSNIVAFQYDQIALINVKPAETGEVMRPTLYNKDNNYIIKSYFRSNDSDDFTDVDLSISISSEYTILPESELDVQVGWGLYQDDQLINTLFIEKQTLPVRQYYSFTKWKTVSFGANLTPGKYQLCQIYKFSDNETWIRCGGYSINSYVAEITSKSLTIRKPDVENMSFKVNNIKTSEQPEAGNTMDIILNMTNTGETPTIIFNFGVQKYGSNIMTIVTKGEINVDPGKTVEVLLNYKPSESGDYTFMVTGTSEEVIKTMTVTIPPSEVVVVDNVKYRCTPAYQRATVIKNDDADQSVLNITIQKSLSAGGVTCYVKAIADEALRNFNKILHIELPEGVETIGSLALAYLNLKEIVLPSTIKKIDNSAFRGNRNLEVVISHIIEPFSVDRNTFSLNSNTQEFELTPSPATLYVPIGSKSLYEVAGWDNQFTKVEEGEPQEAIVGLLKYSFSTGGNEATVINDDSYQSLLDITIPETIIINGKTYKVTAIGSYAFQSCMNITSVSLPEGLVSIGNSAFYYTHLHEVLFPSTLKSIGEYSFAFCNSIKTIVVPEGVESIGSYAFCELANLTRLELPSSLKKLGSRLLTSYDGNRNLEMVVSHITEPISVDDDVFVTFRRNSDNQEYELAPSPATLYIPIGSKFLYEAAGWADQFTKIEEGEPLETTVGVLRYLYTKEGNSATVIWDDTYKGLTEVVIPATVTIGDKIYKVKIVGKDAFAGCWKMKSVTLPEGLVAIGFGAFEGSGLETVVIPEGVETISENAFSYCLNLKKIVLPSTLTSIANNAFYCNTSVEAVISHIVNPCTIPDRVFRLEYWDDLNGEYSYPPSPATLYIPLGTKSLYEAAGWTDQFTKVEEGEPQEDIVGDVNNDGLVDGKDIDAIIRYILEGDYEGFIFENADVNADEKINAADIVEVVKIIKANK